jgi:hypothetical protein
MLIGQVSIASPSGASLASTYVGSGGGFVDTTTLPTTGAYTINVAPLAGSHWIDDAAALRCATGRRGKHDARRRPRIGLDGDAGTERARGVQRLGQRSASASTSRTRRSSSRSCRILKPDGSTLGNNRFIGPGSTFIDTDHAAEHGRIRDRHRPERGVDRLGDGAGLRRAARRGGPITPSGAPVTVTTTVPGQNGRLTFAGTAGQRVSLKVSNVTYSSATAQLLDPSGNAVGGSVLFGTGGGFVDTRALPSTGTYSITIDPPNTTTGAATFTLYNVPPDVTGTITPGEQRSSAASRRRAEREATRSTARPAAHQPQESGRRRCSMG